MRAKSVNHPTVRLPTTLATTVFGETSRPSQALGQPMSDCPEVSLLPTSLLPGPITTSMGRPVGMITTSHSTATDTVVSSSAPVGGGTPMTPELLYAADVQRPQVISGSGAGLVPPPGVASTAGTTSPVVATALPVSMMRPLPRIPVFSGERQEAGEEWHEHFENVSNLAGWDDHLRLVHLTSSLKDTAALFYRSCSADVRNNYRSLTNALKRKFTPVQLTAVQTQLFHNRHQGEKE